MTIDYSLYDDLLADADRDKRIGDCEAVVKSVIHDAWEDGQPRTKVQFNIPAAGPNAKADVTLTEPLAPEALAAQWKDLPDHRKKGAAFNIRLLKMLAEFYGKTREDIKEYDEFKVHTYKSRDGGFIRVDKFLPKDAKLAEKAGSDVPF